MILKVTVLKEILTLHYQDIFYWSNQLYALIL